MYGAILGDMIGSPYEFDCGDKTKDFPLFSAFSRFTDDSVMTIAVAEALLDSRFTDDDGVTSALVRSMQKWGRRYPRAGYGARFVRWLGSADPRPYGSYGNGSAMRVSAAGWLYDTLEETRSKARLTALVTHNHPEGVKGAEAVASAIYLARTGSSKDEIRSYVTREFGYDLSRTCDEIRPAYSHNESCQKTVPEAITAFLEGTGFEDVIRTAVSLGGDCDTLTCIAGSIAEAFYGVPDELKAECRSRVGADMREILDRFDTAREHGSDRFPDDFLTGNVLIEEAVARYCLDSSGENLAGVLDAILRRMRSNGHFLIPVVPVGESSGRMDPELAKPGDAVTVPEELHFKLQHIRSKDGKTWLAAFTSQEEYEKGETSSLVSHFIDVFLEGCADMQEAGVVINPWGQSFPLTKDLIRRILDANKERSSK